MEVVVRLPEPALEEADVLLEIAAHGGGRDEQPVPLRDEHLDELSPAGEERGERLGGRIREHPRLGPDALGKEGEDLGVDRISLGQLAGGFREVAHLARIGDDDRQACGGERGD
jgi:hypothetical protein